MSTTDTVDLRYPIGRFTKGDVAPERIPELIEQLAALPARIRAALEGLGEAELDTPYREGGWTVRQVAHHLPDSHMNAFIRMKLGLTEDNPRIKTYEEARWAELADVRVTPVEVSLALLDALHRRWTDLLRALGPSEWARTVDHPDWGSSRLDQLLELYAWHCNHHLAHITGIRERSGW